MSSNEAPSVSVLRRGPRCLGSDPRRTVVRVCGEHDLATRAHLSDVLDEATRLDDDVVVDLSGVTFMDASTIGALVSARTHLVDHAHSLSVRDPSPPAQLLLELCDLTDMIDIDPTDRPTDTDRPADDRPVGDGPSSAQASIAVALASWVAVPVRYRAATPSEPSPEPASASASSDQPTTGATGGSRPPQVVQARSDSARA